LHNFWQTLTSFCCEHIRSLYIEQICKTVAPPSDEIKNSVLWKTKWELLTFAKWRDFAG